MARIDVTITSSTSVRRPDGIPEAGLPAAVAAREPGLLAALARSDLEAAHALVTDLLSIAGITTVGGRSVDEIADRFVEQAALGTGVRLPNETRAVIERFNRGELTQKDAQLEIEHFWAGALRRAVIDGDVENGSLMAGQSVGMVTCEQDTATILDELVGQAIRALAARSHRAGAIAGAAARPPSAAGPRRPG